MSVHIHPTIQSYDALISLDEAKAQLKLDASFVLEDSLIQGYIDAAVIDCENYTNTSLFTTTFNIEFSEWVNAFAIPISPVNSITSIKYIDTADDEQTLPSATDLYRLLPNDKFCKQIYFTDFENLPALADTQNAVTVEITAGYTAATLPRAIKQAILLRLTNFYENRNDTVEALPKASTNLLRNYRFYY